MPSANRSQDVMDIDEELFRAWQSGDPAARTAAWERFWRRLYSAAYAFSIRVGVNPEDAKVVAQDACNDAWLNIDRKVKEGFQWTGSANFAKLANAHMVYGVRNACKELRGWTNRVKDLLGDSGEERDSRLERLEPAAPNQGADEDRIGASTRKAFEEIVSTLAAWKEMCRKRPALAEVLEAQLEYVRQCVVRNVTGLPRGHDPHTMTLDELVPYIEQDAFTASKQEMSQFIMDRLKISRNQLDTRRRQIRLLIEASEQPDSAPAAL